MAKKVKVAEKRTPTKRQLARWEKEKRRQKIISVAAVVSITVILVLLGVGYYLTLVRPWNQVVVDVNGVTFDMRYVSKVVKILAGGRIDPGQIQSYAGYAPGYVRDQELIRQGVPKLGITATSDEVDQKLREVVLGSNPEEAAKKDFTKEYDARLKAIDMSDAEFRALVTAEILQEKYRSSLAEGVPQKVEQVHVLGLQLYTNTVDAALTRLNKGEDFGAIAKELSIHSSKEKGGDMGWLPRGLMGDNFDTAAFSLEVGKLSDKVLDDSSTSEGGYWLIKVVEKDSQHDLDPAIKTKLADNQFNKWVEGQRSADVNNVTLNWGQDQEDWITSKLLD